MRTPLVIVACAVALMSTPDAAMGSVAKAKKLFSSAEKHFAAGRFEDALAKYKQAFKAKPLPGFHFNIGMCLRALGRHREAIEHFESYLSQAKRPRHRKEAEQLIRDAKAQLAAEQPPDTAPGDSASASDPEGTSDAEKNAAAQPATLPASAPPGPAKRGLSPIFFWSSLGVTGALVVVGSITGALALEKSRSYKDDLTAPSELQGLKDSGEAMKMTSTVSWALAGAFGAATVALFFFTDLSPDETSVSAAPLQGGGGIVVMGRRF